MLLTEVNNTLNPDTAGWMEGGEERGKEVEGEGKRKKEEGVEKEWGGSEGYVHTSELDFSSQSHVSKPTICPVK